MQKKNNKNFDKKVYVEWGNAEAYKKVIRKIENNIKNSNFNINIMAPSDMKTYPNVCVPLAATFDWYREKGVVYNFKFPGKNYVKHTLFYKPLIVEEHLNSAEVKFALDKVWKYSSPEGVDALVTGIVNAIREADVLEAGNLTSVEWCLNEVMDNVLQHSQAESGYVMGQLHKGQKRLSICVLDMGVGIYNTLKCTKHAPRTPIDAITLALQERVTRDERIGQGNGMWGLSSIIRESNGSVKILSNGAVYNFSKGEITTKDEQGLIIGKHKNVTMIDFQIDYSKKLDVAKALNGHELCDFWLENHELEDGEVLFKVKEDSAGTGTRTAAMKFKNIVLNTLKEKNQKIILDFEGVNVVSSSYADELIGKLVMERGFIYFMNHFQLSNLSSNNVGVINRSVEQRMGHIYYSTLLEENE